MDSPLQTRTDTIESILVQICINLGIKGLLPSNIEHEPMAILNADAWDDIMRISKGWPASGTSLEERTRVAQNLLSVSKTAELVALPASELVHQLRCVENW